MKSSRFILWWVGLFLCSAALTAGELRLVVTTDLHGALGNYAVLAPAIRERTKDGNAVVIDLGDTVSGVFSSEYAENASGMAEALNLTGTELWVPGNHDFELDPASFRDFVRRFRGTALGGDWRCAGLAGRPFVVIKRGGVRCAVIGLTDPKMPYRLLPGDDMAFVPPLAVLDKVMPQVLAAHPQLVVLAWHNGLYSKLVDLREVLRRHPGIDVILGGHSHQEHPGRRVGRNTLYIQPGSHGHCAGVVEIRTDDRSGRITGITSQLVRGDTARPDPQLAALDRQLSLSVAGLYRRPLGNYVPPRAGERNSSFGRRCAEALREAANADAALIWIDTGDRAPGQGKLFTYGDLYRLMPHRNRLCVVTVTRGEAEEFIVEREKLIRRRKWSRELFASGIRLHHLAGGGVARIDAPERFTLALSGHLIADSRVLRPLADDPQRGFRNLGLLERDAIADALSRRPELHAENRP